MPLLASHTQVAGVSARISLLKFRPYSTITCLQAPLSYLGLAGFSSLPCPAVWAWASSFAAALSSALSSAAEEPPLDLPGAPSFCSFSSLTCATSKHVEEFPVYFRLTYEFPAYLGVHVIPGKIGGTYDIETIGNHTIRLMLAIVHRNIMLIVNMNHG